MEGQKEGRKGDSTHLHWERGGGAMKRGEAGEGGVYGSRLQGLAKRGSRGWLHFWHPIHLIQLAHCHILLPEGNTHIHTHTHTHTHAEGEEGRGERQTAVRTHMTAAGGKHIKWPASWRWEDRRDWEETLMHFYTQQHTTTTTTTTTNTSNSKQQGSAALWGLLQSFSTNRLPLI